MLKNLLMLPAHLTIGYLAIIVCGTISFFEMFVNNK
jgi:hypothetical protein